MRYKLVIEDKEGNIREYPLDHDYDSIEEAEKEAENLADLVYTEDDEAWTIV